MMTITNDASDTRAYLRLLRRELSPLPRAVRRDTTESIAEHLNDSEGDPRPLATVVGAPALIAHAALLDHDRHHSKPLRPAFTMASRRLHLVVALGLGLPAVYGLAMLTFDGRDWPFWAQLRELLHLAPLIPVLLAPLLVRWKRWWLVSVLALTAYVLYLAALVVVVAAAPTNLLAATLYPLPLPAVLAIHTPVLVLLVGSLLIAPRSLRQLRSRA
jgi:hypothetical protein